MKKELFLEKTLPNKQAIRAVVTTKDGYFSITGYLGEIVRDRNTEPIAIAGKTYKIWACGCLHDEIKEAFPQLEKFIPLHLSNLKGVPMYAMENGMYWAKQNKVETLAKHLRISIDDAKNLCKLAKVDFEGQVAKMFASFVEEQKERWSKEAQEFISFI